MELYKYKKISLNALIKKLDENNNNIYITFFNLYISNYLKKFKIDSIDTFKSINIKQLNFYKEYYKNVKIYFHYLYDKEVDKIIAIEKTIDMDKNFYNIKYFKDILPEDEQDYTIYGINLYIDENYRGKSLCKKLINNIQQNSKKHNFKYIISEIHDQNIPSIKCHISADFKKLPIVSYRDTYYYIKKL
jgi:hypothetical protein